MTQPYRENAYIGLSPEKQESFRQLEELRKEVADTTRLAMSKGGYSSDRVPLHDRAMRAYEQIAKSLAELGK
jgi:hypothetical protein